MPLTALERLKAARCQVKFPEEKESVHDIIVRLACKSQAGSERSSWQRAQSHSWSLRGSRRTHSFRGCFALTQKNRLSYSEPVSSEGKPVSGFQLCYEYTSLPRWSPLRELVGVTKHVIRVEEIREWRKPLFDDMGMSLQIWVHSLFKSSVGLLYFVLEFPTWKQGHFHSLIFHLWMGTISIAFCFTKDFCYIFIIQSILL